VDVPYVVATLQYTTKDGAESKVVVTGNAFNASQNLEVERHRHRLEAIDCIRRGVVLMKEKDQQQAQKIVKNLIQQIKGSATNSNPNVQALLKDLEGQVTEAFSKSDWFTKWGVHYLPSLVNAHLLQICNNFKDPGVQVYGGKLFTELRDKADDIFVKLPPPKPSHHTTAPVQNMAVYHRSGGVCFHGESMVQMANGKQKMVKDITKGSRVMTPSGKAEVLCVVKTHCLGNTTSLVQLGGLLITPFHPVRINGKWEFPCNLGQVMERPCTAVFSFVLKEKHIMIINGIECVTLGHDFQNEVVQHPYFGSRRVIEDLEKMRGWNSGVVDLQSGCLVHDSATSLVCGLVQH